MFRFKNKKIKIFLDGVNKNSLKNKTLDIADGLTYNPSLFRKLKVQNYLLEIKNISKKYNNSLTGLLINMFNLITLSIATTVANHSLYLTIILFFNIFIYIFTYILLNKKN